MKSVGNRFLLISSVLMVVLLACSNPESPFEKPPNITGYTYDTTVYVVDSVILPNSPVCKGVMADSFSVRPALPAGLSFNSANGYISGKPMVVSAETPYVVYAKNEYGTDSITILITVNPRAPAGLFYSATLLICTTGTSVRIKPTLSGSVADSFSIAPVLPSGLFLNADSGVIAGIPADTSSPKAYSVRAHNPSGYADAIVMLAVVAKSVAVDTHSIPIKVTLTGNGSVLPSGVANVVSAKKGQDQRFLFAANAGYQITEVRVNDVRDSVAANTGEYTFRNIQAACSLLVVCTRKGYTLTVTGVNATITKVPDLTSYPFDTVVSLTVQPAQGFTFSGWSGDTLSSATAITVRMNTNKAFTANCVQVGSFAVNVAAVNGSVLKSPDKTSYLAGDTVTLTATANIGYLFDGWTGDLTGSVNPIKTTVNATKNITANFKAIRCTLTITAAQGSATRSPDSASYAYGTSVTINAVPGTGYVFSQWSGDTTGGSTPVVLKMVRNRSIVAGFVKKTFALNITAAGGRVTLSPDKILYNAGDSVTLTAVADSAHTFAGWGGSLSGVQNPAKLVMDTIRTVQANFVIRKCKLQVTALNGKVTRAPDSAFYSFGTSVIVTAVADTGFNFTGWSGDTSVNSATFTIKMNGDKSVTANFARIGTYTVNVTAVGGSVAKSPAKANYAYGDTVTLTATPDSAHTFAGWSGDAAGSVNPVKVVINASKTITALFAVKRYSITVTVANGSVAKTPDSTLYAHGTSVKLKANPDTGYSFIGWSGALSGTKDTATVVMMGDKVVTATFALKSCTLTVVANNGTVDKSPSKGIYQYGDLVQLTANANTNYHFKGWSGDTTGSVNPVVVTMNRSKVVTGVFDPDAPRGLSYREMNAVYVTGYAITPNNPTIQGGPVEKYSVIPVLPTGLMIDSVTGVITGTPQTRDYSPVQYSVKARNVSGACSTMVTIERKLFIITSPITGMSFRIGDTLWLQWKADPSENMFDIDLSVDAGIDYNMLNNVSVRNTDPKWGNWPWKVLPQVGYPLISTVSSECVIRIRLNSNPSINEMSGLFRISP